MGKDFAELFRKFPNRNSRSSSVFGRQSTTQLQIVGRRCWLWYDKNKWLLSFNAFIRYFVFLHVWFRRSFPKAIEHSLLRRTNTSVRNIPWPCFANFASRLTPKANLSNPCWECFGSVLLFAIQWVDEKALTLIFASPYVTATVPKARNTPCVTVYVCSAAVSKPHLSFSYVQLLLPPHIVSWE